jgi:hypothetical protein
VSVRPLAALAAASGDQVGLEYDCVVWMISIADLVEEEFGGDLAHVTARLTGG